MKIRTDFVTNSSSSSFIAAFAKIGDKNKATPFIEKELLNILEENEQSISRLRYADDGTHLVTGKEILEVIKINERNVADLIKSPPAWMWEKPDPVAAKAYTISVDWAGVEISVHKNDIDPDALYYIYIDGGVGDEDDFWDKESLDMDYDIGLGFFPEEMQKKYNEFTEENGFTDIQKDFGARRDG